MSFIFLFLIANIFFSFLVRNLLPNCQSLIDFSSAYSLLKYWFTELSTPPLTAIGLFPMLPAMVLAFLMLESMPIMPFALDYSSEISFMYTT